VQYIMLPEFDWPRLRKEFPEEFENPVGASIVPTGWVKLRVIVEGSKVQIYVGPVKEVTLAVRKLGQLDGGQIGLWVGNGSGGDFANLVVTPTRYWLAAQRYREPSGTSAVFTPRPTRFLYNGAEGSAGTIELTEPASPSVPARAAETS
jgi:hypothetical protein